MSTKMFDYSPSRATPNSYDVKYIRIKLDRTMNLGKTLYVSKASNWRRWLEKHHNAEKEIWLVFPHKNTAKPKVPYNDAVEEALCFGWIDSIVKSLDKDNYAQRFTPRKPNSPVSEMNKERARRLIKQGKMTPAGLKTLGDLDSYFKIPSDILSRLKKDKAIWNNFQKFPESYQKIRIAFVQGARNRQEEFKRRLNHFLKMTRENKKFGMVQ